jgi:hypothetical protein
MTNKNKEHCETECNSTNFHLVEGVFTPPLLSITHLCSVLSSRLALLTCVHVWPWKGLVVAQQCLSLARGVCTLAQQQQVHRPPQCCYRAAEARNGVSTYQGTTVDQERLCRVPRVKDKFRRNLSD